MFGCVWLSRVRPLPLAVTALIGFAVLMSAHSPAEARRKRAGGYAPPYAEIVIDVNTGKVLRALNADALRHPASITKVMTLYLLFEQIDRGRYRLESPLRVSAFAARQAPSKIGLEAGETIEVEEAIKALVTKSANDVAVVVAENIAGSQDDFAELMTRKARSLGMSRTVFRNASGLPDPEQVTTARDLTILGRALHEKFPRYWHYFQMRQFDYAGTVYRNHNRLLGRVEGVDGIKTGYTRASGFNLLTSARAGGRHVMAVVLGGRSGRARDAQMASMVEDQLPRAYAGSRIAPSVFAEARVADREPEPVRVAAAVATEPKAVEAKAVERPRTPDVRPAVVAELPRASARPADGDQQAARPAPTTGGATVARTGLSPTLATTTPGSSALRWIVGAQPALQATEPAGQLRLAVAQEQRALPSTALPYAGGAARRQAEEDEVTTSTAEPRKTITHRVEPAKTAEPRKADVGAETRDTATGNTGSAGGRPAGLSGWVIQLGAADDEQKARAILDNARLKNRTILAEASPFTEKVQKGDSTLYRARFGGFESDDAQAACRALKRSGFACFAQRI